MVSVNMRVLFIDTAGAMGGAQRSLVELAAALGASGVSCHAAVPAGPLAEALIAAEVPVRRIPAVRLYRGWHWRQVTGLLHLVIGAPMLARAIRATRPDVLHANGLTAALLANAVWQKRPVIWHVRDLNMPFGVVRRVGRRVACVVAISESVDERVSEMMPAFCQGRVRLVHNGIDTRHFQPGDRAAARRVLGLPPDAPLVGMVAHLAPWKRHDQFLEIAARIRATQPGVRFVLAASDPFDDHRTLRARLEAQAASLGLTDALTWLPHDFGDPAILYHALDVLVHPTANEPFGRVLCEAMASERPVVAANSAGPGGIVPTDIAGFLVTPGRIDLFAQQTLRLLGDPGLARRMGAAARQHVLAKFDIARTAGEMQALYADVLARIARAQAQAEVKTYKSGHSEDDDE